MSPLTADMGLSENRVHLNPWANHPFPLLKVPYWRYTLFQTDPYDSVSISVIACHT